MTEKCQRSFHRKHVEKTPEKSNFFYPTSRVFRASARGFRLCTPFLSLRENPTELNEWGGYRVFIIRVLLDDHNLSNVEWATNQANTWTEKVRGREGNN